LAKEKGKSIQRCNKDMADSFTAFTELGEQGVGKHLRVVSRLDALARRPGRQADVKNTADSGISFAH
jgi:hypothetical protein